MPEKQGGIRPLSGRSSTCGLLGDCIKMASTSSAVQVQLCHHAEWKYDISTCVGFIGSSSVLRTVGEHIQVLRDERNKDSSKKRPLRFVCDPVIGDNGEAYGPSLLGHGPVYREHIIPFVR